MGSDILDAQFESYSGFNGWLTQRRYQYLSKFFVGERCLEFGVGDGRGTVIAAQHFDEIVCVDGSQRALDNIEVLADGGLVDNVSTVCAPFEDVELEGKFDTILLCHVLEHVDDPVKLLEKAKRFLAEEGKIIIDVPNAHSLHRKMGVLMGILSRPDELNDADISIGHQRVYDGLLLMKHVRDAGLLKLRSGGMFLKLLPNDQMLEVFNRDQLEALFRLGQSEGNAAELYMVATRG